MGLNSTIKQVFFWVVIIVGAILLYQVFHNSGGSPPTELSYSELVKKVTDHEVQDAKIEPNKVTGNLTNRNHYTTKIAGEFVARDLADLMNKNNVSVQFEPSSTSGFWVSLLATSAPFIFILAFWIFMVRQMLTGGNKALSFG
jgi:cell division protease FtsH